MKIGVDKSEIGWELTWDDAFGPEGSTVYATKAAAQRACRQAKEESREWESRPLCDAPHMDAHD